jgi:hypothetical protein
MPPKASERRRSSFPHKVEPLEQLVVIEVVGTEQEADLICGLLRTADIECLVRHTNLGAGASDGLSVVGPYEVAVAAQDLEAAREILASRGATFDVDDGQ